MSEKTVVFAIFLAWCASHLAQGQELIERREQARAAFLASPEGIYGHYCAHCHGEGGVGNGRLWATELSPKPTDLTASDLDEAALVKFITQGSAALGKSSFCPPWGRTISAANIERLALYIRSLRGEATLPASAPAASAAAREPAGDPFPWKLAGVVLAELLVLGWLFRRWKETQNAVPENPPLRR